MTEYGNLSEELDLLAAEYALGLAGDAEYLRAAELEAGDAEFARRVAQWRDHGAGWLEEVEGEPVGEHVWRGLAPLFKDAPVAANDAAMSGEAPSQTTDWATQAQSWRNRSYLAIAASLVLAVLLGAALTTGAGSRPAAIGPSSDPAPIASAGDPVEPTVRNVAVAQIPSAEGAPLISAAYDPDQGALRLRVAEFDTVDKAPELWVLDTSGKPVSLGLVDERELTVELSDKLRALLVEGAVIAVTLEDRETAPHDAPTGAILGTGKLVVF